MKISEGAQKLYEILPSPNCWMTERHLAKAVGCRTTKIKGYKAELANAGLITILLRPNGKRANLKHEIIKLKPPMAKNSGSPICKHISCGSVFFAWASLDRNMLIECYLNSGWEIVPFRAGAKRPLPGFSLETWRRLDKLEKFNYFYDHPTCNVGLVICPHLLVVDVETKQHPWSEHENFIHTLTASTPRGFHYYFRHDPTFTTRAKVLPDLDIRGPASFVVLPPSVSASGIPYTWETVVRPNYVPPALRHAWQTAGRSSQPAHTNFSLNTIIPQGARNDTLWRQGRSLRQQGKTMPEIEHVLLERNRQYCSPPLPRQEMKLLLRNIATRPDRPSFRPQPSRVSAWQP